MRPIKRIFLLLLIAVTAMCINPQKASAQVSYQVFYDDLSPYGVWVNNPTYGYVWVPNEGPGFVPYQTAGHWVYTEYGWTWVSDYAWGWAPFHYGRWYTDPQYGAMWVPDNNWGPAWVTWRRSEGYYGWAPMEPGISVSVYVGGGYDIPNDRWCFVHDRDFGRPDIHNYYVSRTENVTVMHNSAPISNTVVDHNRNQTYAAGPPSNDVQRATGRSINTVAVHDAGKPSQSQNGNELNIYRPKVQNTTANGQKSAPPRVAQMNDLKPAAQRKAGEPAARPEAVKAPVKDATPVRTAPNNNTGVRPQPVENRNANNTNNKNAPAPVRQPQPVQRVPAASGQPPRQNNAQREQPANGGRPMQQQAPVRQAPPSQPMRQEQPRQQQPMRQAPMQQQPQRQQEPMRQAPMQQQQRQPEPMRQAPMQEQQRQPEPMHQAPMQEQQRQPEPMRQTPVQEPQRQTEPMRQEAPRPEPQHGPR